MSKETKDEQGYSGWSNYETWLYKLWLDNDEGSYNYWREKVAEVRAERKTEDCMKIAIANYLEEEINDLAEAQLDGVSGLLQDMVNSAIKEIDFYEIAENLLSE